MESSPFPDSITFIIGLAVLLTGCLLPFLEDISVVRNLLLSFWAGLGSAELIYFVLLYQEKKETETEKKHGVLPSILLISLSKKQKNEQLKAAIGTLQPFPVTTALLFVIFYCAQVMGMSPLLFAIVPSLVLLNSSLFFSYDNKKIILPFLLAGFCFLGIAATFYSAPSIKSGLYVLIWSIIGTLKEKLLTTA